MRFKSLVLAIGVSAFLSAAVLSLHAAISDRSEGPTVTIAVQASDTSGGHLHYRWRSTDGKIRDVNAPTTTWTLPVGPGLHFAYVLVSNGLGGYTERRIAVNTDTIGAAKAQEDTFASVLAPKGAAPVGDYYRSFVQWGVTTPPDALSYGAVYQPDIAAFLQDNDTLARYPSTGTVKSDEKGQIVVAGVPPGYNYTMNCSIDGGVNFQDCTGGANVPVAIMDSTAISDYIQGGNNFTIFPISGSLKLADGKPCGTFNEFFGLHVTGTVALLDTGGKIVSGPVRVNEFGNYSILPNANAVSLVLKCEKAKPIAIGGFDLTVGGDVGLSTIAGVKAPKVAGMTATYGQLLAEPVAIFLPPPTKFPSDILQRPDGFLAEKGLDSRLGSCQYYKAVGAVKSCDAAGNFSGAISFQDWRHAVKIGEYATPGVPTFKAAYINKVDLNLARVQESITYGPNKTAGVVCNHLGPPAKTPDQLMNPSQADIDAAVDNAVANKNLVACVAMDYTVTRGVNNNKPFIRFLIFGPSGELLPSINLDGRREKFVPGTCVVCHGGDHYAGKFPEDGSGFANIGAHFLPYDSGNFEFSSKPGLREADQERALYHLNQNVLNAGPTQAARDLIAGWYASGKSLDKNYVPASWLATKDPTAIKFYKNVVARSCRTCHVNMIEDYNFDHYQNMAPDSPGYNNRMPDIQFDVGISVCGGSSDVIRNHMMPNSLITFNRFWLSSGTADDQLALLDLFYGGQEGSAGCPPPAGTLP